MVTKSMVDSVIKGVTDSDKEYILSGLYTDFKSDMTEGEGLRYVCDKISPVVAKDGREEQKKFKSADAIGFIYLGCWIKR